MTCSGAILNLSNSGSFTRTRLSSSRFSTRALNPPSFSSHFEVNICGRPQLSKPIKWCRLSPPNAIASLELPLLPFNTNEVLVPSERKTLHLYEARYLALLEESLARKYLFVHFVLDPILVSNSGTEASFAARYGCLVHIENVERLDVGALVSIRGIGRVKMLQFLQSEPYLKGEVIPMRDRTVDHEINLSSKIDAVKEALYKLNSLEIKLKAPKEALMQTRIANSLTWAEKEPFLGCEKAFIPSAAERISFAALQPISASTQSEIYKLQLRKLLAMDVRDTVQRLDVSLDFLNANISMVAAKLAIQSVGMQ